jgi:hypothetical protein
VKKTTPSSATAALLHTASLYLGILVVMLVIGGCAAAYSGMMRGSLSRLRNADYDGALAKLEKPSGSTNMLLYRLERGLILHYQGDYKASNLEFEAAERTIDQLYTRSLSRGVASLFTNDAIVPYTGEEFERVLIHYYRALNYNHLGEFEDAVVECRKANLRLADFAAQDEYELSYKNDAFVQYMTGLFFEAAGDWNDAYVSYKDAERGYRAYSKVLGTPVPEELRQDLVRMASALGYDDDVERYVHLYPGSVFDPESSLAGTVVVFIETGLVAEKRQQVIELPILESDQGVDHRTLSRRAAGRHHYPRRRYAKVDYWLKIALPQYQERPSPVRAVRLRRGTEVYPAVLMEDLDAIATKSFSEKESSIVTRAAARALVKYVAREKAENKSEILGFLVNLLGVSTEAADTRSWLSLPSKIYMARAKHSPGTVDLVVELLNENGKVVESSPLTGIVAEADRPVVISYRSFK